MHRAIGGAVTALFLGWPGLAAAEEVFFGTLHAHSSYSDGSGKPSEAYATARRNGMQFMLLSEHNHNAAEPKTGDRADKIQIAEKPHLYAGAGRDSLKSMAAEATQPGRFVALWGQEFSTIGSGNHVNVLGAPAVIEVPKGEFKQLVAWLDAHPDDSGQPPLIQFNHPEWEPKEDNNYGRDDWDRDDAAWVAAMGAKSGLIEVLNGTATKPGTFLRTYAHETEYFEYLNLGFRLGPTAGHDNHYKNWGTSTYARTGVVAAALTKPEIMKALRARHTFATEDDNLRVVFRGNGGLMGDIVASPAQDDELDLTLEISDPDEADATYHVEVFRDLPGGETLREPVQSYDFEGDGVGPRKLDGVFFQTPGEYVFVKVTQRSVNADDQVDRDRAWTAPIWFGGRQAPAEILPASATLRLTSLVPDPRGSDLFEESITLQNKSAETLSLAGWMLRDEAGRLWRFNAHRTAAPGEIVTLKRNREELSLNNGGDTVELLAPDGRVVQTFSYGPVAVDEVVTP